VTTPVRSRNVAAAFEERAARAEALARVTPVAREPLRFATGLLRAQARVAAGLESAHRDPPLSGRLTRDVERMLGELRAVCKFASAHAPAPLADEARSRSTESDDSARTRLMLFWSGDRSASEDYLSRAMLRPYVEVLREMNVAPDRARAQGRCPFCGGAPVIACRRSGSEADGALRSLVCAVCGLEWTFQRILCPACMESTPEKLPAFTSESHPAVRVEACETCRRYVKSLDLSQDGQASPEVDDLASLALDLWAIDQGFTRIEPGLAGV
jgi:formate dehydrogenase accessory protein FdhE